MMSATAEHVDITEEFFTAVNQMKNGKVEKINQFDMLEGARALEMGNFRLDTGLLEFEPEELSFDSGKGLSLPIVVAIMNKLLILYMSWLKGSSLSVTLLSSRHVLDFLQSFKKHGLKDAKFSDPRLYTPSESNTESVSEVSFEWHFVNTVLRAFVIGICKLTGFSLDIGTNVLYEEEDLVTRSMNFNFLQQISPQIAMAEIVQAEVWLKGQNQLSSDPEFHIAVELLGLIRELVRLETIPQMEIRLFQEPHPKRLPNAKKILGMIEKFRSISFADVPKPAFSRFVQLDCDNKHLPNKNVTISQVEAYDEFKDVVEAIDWMILQFTSIKNTCQLEAYLKYEVGQKLASKANAFTRGFFQLFFIRDDKSIVGSNESILSITNTCLDRFSLCGNSIMNPHQWNIQGSKDVEATRGEFLNKMAEVLNDLESTSIHKLGVHGNNRCRQRQTNNRLIVLWDSLHFNVESLEAELFQYSVGDKLSPALNDQPAFGISSYVYYQKLETMVDVALSGFEEDLYKLHEAPLMYWYASIVHNEAHQLITSRAVNINKGKICAIQNLPKKIKSTKAGLKKDSLRAEYASLKEHVVPILTENIVYLEKYLALSQSCLFYATRSISTTISIMSCLYDSNKRSGSLVPDEALYKLRMKPWSSVGVPEMPNYETYVAYFNSIQTLQNLPMDEKKRKILPHVELASDMLEKAISCCKELCFNLENDQVVKDLTTVGDTCAPADWFSQLQKTCESYKAQLKGITDNCDRDCIVKRSTGYIAYFPIYQVEVKN